jgi:hypothetical protein
MMEEDASHFSRWSDVIALLASLVFARPVIRTSFRLRRAEQTEAHGDPTMSSRESGQELALRSANRCGPRQIIWPNMATWPHVLART